ncbi:MAG: DEAD/DEAH box helicase [Actinobacteria bacterium]|nr:DEAD/DEAH box helicase [Actinomycetota bacterium]
MTNVPTKPTFSDLGLAETFTLPLADDGISEPFEIQSLAIPLALDRHDLIGQARTGSGKTLAFGLPILQHVDPTFKKAQGLIVTPTRELCLQIVEDLTKAGRESDVTVAAVYGGVPIEPQAKALTGGAHIVVGTPGRLLDHLGRGNLDLSTIRTLVLDEADEMLDMGFLPDVERLIRACPDDRQTLLFSATMRSEIVELARRYLRKPTFLRAQDQELSMPSGIEHHFFITHKLDKPRVLARVLQQPARGLALVFTRTKYMADRLVQELNDLGVDSIAIHGDLRQQTRERNLGRFRDNKVDVLVATEVAARGLDIGGMTHVVNYDCPDDEKMYLHRVGRTARAGEHGVAITFATHAEVDRLNVIRKALELREHTFEEVFSTSKELTERFDLPAATPWDQFGRSAGSGEGRGAKSRGSARSGRKPSKNDPRPGRSEQKPSKRDQRSGRSEQKPSKTDEAERSRSRGREPERADPQLQEPTTVNAEPSFDLGDDSEVVRTRTRSRITPEMDADAGRESTADTGGRSSGRSRSRARSTSGDSSGQRSSSRSGSKSGSRSRSGSGSRATAGAKAGSEGGSRRSGRRDDDSSRAGQHERPEPVPQPRGNGQPRLSRPLKVEHIP